MITPNQVTAEHRQLMAEITNTISLGNNYNPHFELIEGNMCYVDLDGDDTLLMNALAAWNDGVDTYPDRVLAVNALLTVKDDGDEDKLTGSSSRDVFFDGVGDHLTDLGLDDTLIPLI